MANLGHSKIMLGLMKEEKDDYSSNIKQAEDNFLAKPSSSITDENEFDIATIPREQNVQEEYYHPTDNGKRVKIMENGISNFLKLKAFFEIVQNQHPESRLELQQVDGNWKVWCGACKKLLRPDKSGKAIHNIQRQHFTSSRHQKKLTQMLQAEAGNGRQNMVLNDNGAGDIEPQDVQN